MHLAHEWLTRSEAALYLKISLRQLGYLTDAAKKLRPKERIPSHLIGKRRLYRRDELDAYVASQDGKPGETEIGPIRDVDVSLGRAPDDDEDPPRPISYEDMGRIRIGGDGSIFYAVDGEWVAQDRLAAREEETDIEPGVRPEDGWRPFE